MEILSINRQEIENSSITKLEGKIRKVDTEIWESEIAEKKTCSSGSIRCSNFAKHSLFRGKDQPIITRSEDVSPI